MRARNLVALIAVAAIALISHHLIGNYTTIAYKPSCVLECRFSGGTLYEVQLDKRWALLPGEKTSVIEITRVEFDRLTGEDTLVWNARDGQVEQTVYFFTGESVPFP